jgi:hypothetical protein
MTVTKKNKMPEFGEDEGMEKQVFAKQVVVCSVKLFVLK